jgi:hypothetical protein
MFAAFPKGGKYCILWFTYPSKSIFTNFHKLLGKSFCFSEKILRKMSKKAGA